MTSTDRPTLRSGRHIQQGRKKWAEQPRREAAGIYSPGRKPWDQQSQQPPPRRGRLNMNSFVSRRSMLARTGTGLGLLGLAALAERSVAAPIVASANPLAPKVAHFPAKAKHVIHLFMNGGPSQVDTFDPKPALAKYAGKALPMPNLRTERKTGAALPSPFKFQKYGQSGIEVSELFHHTAQSIDD